MLLDLTPREIVSMTQDGNDLIIETVDGRTLKIVDFYVDAGEGASELYLVDESGEVLLADLSPAGADGLVMAQYVPQGELAGFEILGAEGLAATAGEGDGIGGGLFAAAGVAVLAGISGSSTGGSSSRAPGDPDVGAPSDFDFADDGSSISGRGQPGTAVIVTDSDGNVIGDGLVDENGDFTVDLDPPVRGGDEITVVAEDGDGNQSDPVTVTVPEGVGVDEPNGSPTLEIEAAADGFINAEELEGGVTAEVGLAGTGAEEGDTVTITVEGESGEVVTTEYTLTADDIAAGSASILLDMEGIPEGEVSVTATVTVDGEGSAPSDAEEFVLDTEAPESPGIDEMTTNEDGTVTVSGEAESGSTVTVTFPDGSEGEAVAGEDGGYEVTSETAQPSGEVSATATDPAGNASEPATADYEAEAQENPILTIAAAADGFVNADELDAGVEAQVLLNTGAQEGDELTITVEGDGGPFVTTHTLTVDDIAAGSITLTLDVDGIEDGEFSATADIAGSVSNVVGFELDT
ncbi:hypothetical protein C1H66_21340, partial [Halomonas heilongjiangensis]